MTDRLARPGTRPRAQRGAASIAIALILMLMLAAAITASLRQSSSSMIDATLSDQQTAALYIAESGLERAQYKLAAGEGAS